MGNPLNDSFWNLKARRRVGSNCKLVFWGILSSSGQCFGGIPSRDVQRREFFHLQHGFVHSTKDLAWCLLQQAWSTFFQFGLLGISGPARNQGSCSDQGSCPHQGSCPESRLLLGSRLQHRIKAPVWNQGSCSESRLLLGICSKIYSESVLLIGICSESA